MRQHNSSFDAQQQTQHIIIDLSASKLPTSGPIATATYDSSQARLKSFLRNSWPTDIHAAAHQWNLDPTLVSLKNLDDDALERDMGLTKIEIRKFRELSIGLTKIFHSEELNTIEDV